MSAVVEFREATYSAGERLILRGITFAVEEGETLVLLGRSGSGKTTALRMVNALLAPESGDVRVSGKPTRDWDSIALRRNIGYAIQDTGLFPHWTVARNVSVVPRLLGWNAARIENRVNELLEVVGLAPARFRDRSPRELSGGEKQRVGIARALAGDPGVLLFDEPFAAVDPITRFELQQMFVNLNRRYHKTALFVTHDVREALLVGARIALLEDGVLVWHGPASDFVRAPVAEAEPFIASLEAGRNIR
jgi:osmoprotectant transport system ATP-binding protein